MQFLPIVQRELLVASRKRATYLSRSLSAGILLAFFPSVWNMQPGVAGARLLQFLSVIVFLECLFAGVRYTSDCLSEEKREGTLGLLFLTNLSGFDVVAGKMVAQSIPAIFNLVAAIPILAISVLAGGVTGEQIFSLSLALLAITVFSLCIGAFISSRAYAERAVLVQTLLFLILISLFPVVLSEIANQILPRFSRALDWVHALQKISPFHLFTEAGRGFGREVRPGLWTLFVSSIALLAYASWRIRHHFGEPEKLTTQRALKSRRIRRRQLNLRKFGANPILRLALGDRSSKSLVFSFCVFVVFFGAFVRLGLENNWGWVKPVTVLGTYAAHVLFKFLVTAETCRQLNQDKRSGALELLLTTPITAAQVVRGQFSATFKTWVPAAVCLAIMNILWMTEDSFMRDLGVLLPCSIVLIAADSYALTWRSILNSIQGERYVRTVCKTFFRLIIPPMAVIFIVIFLGMGASARSETMQIIFVLWTLASVVYDLILAFDARSRLKNLRALASGDSGRPGPHRPPHLGPIAMVPSGKLTQPA